VGAPDSSEADLGRDAVLLLSESDRDPRRSDETHEVEAALAARGRRRMGKRRREAKVLKRDGVEGSSSLSLDPSGSTTSNASTVHGSRRKPSAEASSPPLPSDLSSASSSSQKEFEVRSQAASARFLFGL